jgi:transcriptional regulator with XRE-family HTH domain
MNRITPPDIGAILKTYVKKHRLRQNGWARQEGKNRRTIAKYLKGSDMRVSTLLEICQALNYNFLRDIAAMLPPEMPPQNIHPLETRVAELEQQNLELQLQVKTLEKALSLVGGR